MALLLNHLFIEEQWLYTMIVFDVLLAFVGFVFLIEASIGNRYNHLFLNHFLNQVIKTVNPNYLYENKPRQFNGQLLNTKIFDYDSQINIHHLVQLNDCLFYDAQIYINTYRSNKIVQFNGYIIVLPCVNQENTQGLILNHKKPYLGNYKLVKKLDFNRYQIYCPKNKQFDLNKIERIKQVLLKYNKAKFYLSLQDEIIIFKRNRISFFRKPLFKKIDQAYFDAKVSAFKAIEEMIENFALCLK